MHSRAALLRSHAWPHGWTSEHVEDSDSAPSPTRRGCPTPAATAGPDHAGATRASIGWHIVTPCTLAPPQLSAHGRRPASAASRVSRLGPGTNRYTASATVSWCLVILHRYDWSRGCHAFFLKKLMPSTVQSIDPKHPQSKKYIFFLNKKRESTESAAQILVHGELARCDTFSPEVCSKNKMKILWV